MDTPHEVTKTLTTWTCSCGNSGVIISANVRTFACDEVA